MALSIIRDRYADFGPTLAQGVFSATTEKQVQAITTEIANEVKTR